MQALEVTLRDSDVVTLGNAMRIVENATTPNDQN
jgi:hypothetical protein